VNAWQPSNKRLPGSAERWFGQLNGAQLHKSELVALVLHWFNDSNFNKLKHDKRYKLSNLMCPIGNAEYHCVLPDLRGLGQ
jgi:hypothetical protein